MQGVKGWERGYGNTEPTQSELFVLSGYLYFRVMCFFSKVSSDFCVVLDSL